MSAGSLFKFFHEAGGSEHNGTLQWSRTGDMPPLRNLNQIALTEAEVEAVEQIVDFHCDVFELWDPVRLRAYCAVQDRIANGWYTLAFIDRVWVSEHSGWRVLLEWNQIYGEIPPSKVSLELRGPIAPSVISLVREGG
jgi:hypothetical protein